MVETADETSENYRDERRTVERRTVERGTVERRTVERGTVKRRTVERLNRFLCDQGTNTFMELHVSMS